jgi:hypothetical protein
VKSRTQLNGCCICCRRERWLLCARRAVDAGVGSLHLPRWSADAQRGCCSLLPGLGRQHADPAVVVGSWLLVVVVSCIRSCRRDSLAPQPGETHRTLFRRVIIEPLRRASRAALLAVAFCFADAPARRPAWTAATLSWQCWPRARCVHCGCR